MPTQARLSRLDMVSEPSRLVYLAQRRARQVVRGRRYFTLSERARLMHDDGYFSMHDYDE